jgi:UDP-N-acetylglucosamine 1-carboxyvinyltransferase
VRKMRASVLVLGALVGRFGQASVSLPGGCAIGTRGIDLHLKAIEMLGASMVLENGYVNAKVNKQLVGCDINFPTATVTGTENIMMAACFAKGTTRIINAAMEPEIFEFAKLLNKMGAKISGHGTSIITIEGVESLHGCDFDIIPDRIETGTYAIATAITGGQVFLEGAIYDHSANFFESLKTAGVSCETKENGILVSMKKENFIKGVDVITAPYPGFPTDLQAQFMVIMAICNGVSSITENIFENRFMHVPELIRMGANIIVRGKTAVISGVKKLNGAHVMATDLRASVSLVLAGLIANGETTINRLYHLDRGYENIDQKLTNCGAILERFAKYPQT